MDVSPLRQVVIEYGENIVSIWFSGDEGVSVSDAKVGSRGAAWPCGRCMRRRRRSPMYAEAPLGAGMSMKDYPSRALIVDDEPHVRALLRDFLATVCDEVATAASGEEALAIVPMFQPDVILTDMMMPGMSGPDLLDRCAGSASPCR